MLTSPNTPNGKHSEFEIRNSLFEAVRRRRSLGARCLMLSANFLAHAPAAQWNDKDVDLARYKEIAKANSSSAIEMRIN